MIEDEDEDEDEERHGHLLVHALGNRKMKIQRGLPTCAGNPSLPYPI
jgi:hypothetical protein